MSGTKLIDLLAEYSTKEREISPTFFVIKVPFEVPHDCGTTLFSVGMYFWDPFAIKRRSPLDRVSIRTLIVFCLTISLSLASLESSLNPPRCLEDLFKPFFFEFSHLLGLLNDFPALEFHELLGLSPKTFNIATFACF